MKSIIIILISLSSVNIWAQDENSDYYKPLKIIQDIMESPTSTQDQFDQALSQADPNLIKGVKKDGWDYRLWLVIRAIHSPQAWKFQSLLKTGFIKRSMPQDAISEIYYYFVETKNRDYVCQTYNGLAQLFGPSVMSNALDEFLASAPLDNHYLYKQTTFQPILRKECPPSNIGESFTEFIQSEESETIKADIDAIINPTILRKVINGVMDSIF